MTTSAPARLGASHTAALTMPAMVGGGRPLWLSAMAGLALHAVLALAWWLAPHDTRPVAASTTMTVRLAEAPQAGAARPHHPLPAQPTQNPQPTRRQQAESAAAVHTLTVTRPLPAAPPALTARRAPATLSTPLHLQPSTHRATTAPITTTGGAATLVDAPLPVATAAAPAAPAAPQVVSNPGPVANTSNAAVSAQATQVGDAQAPVDMPSSSIRYLVQPVLTFPPGSEELGESGAVTLRFLVDEKGVPVKVERVKSSGYPRLDQHAIGVIRRARCVPHLVQGEPRAFWATQTLIFVLH